MLFRSHFLSQLQSTWASVIVPFYTHYTQCGTFLLFLLRVFRSYLAYLEIGRRIRHLFPFAIPSSLCLFLLAFFYSFAMHPSRNRSKLLRFSYACILDFRCFHELWLLSFLPSYEKPPRKQWSLPYSHPQFIVRGISLTNSLLFPHELHKLHVQSHTFSKLLV